MTRTKIAAAALAAITLATTMTAGVGEAQAKWKGRHGIGYGIAAGLLLGTALAANSYAGPAYGYGYRQCRLVREYDAYGYPRTVRVCHVPY